MNEEQFFTNISKRLDRNRVMDPPRRTVEGAPEFWKDPAAHAYDVVERFTSELESLGGYVQSVYSREELCQYISHLLATLAPQLVGVWGGDFIKSFGLSPTVEPYETVKWGGYGIESFQHVDVSITGCAYAVADTGTFVLMSNPMRGRSVAVLPTVHIVIIEESQIVHRLGEVLERLSEQTQGGKGLSSSIHFVTGPSRSSDIENDQTIGIHGPAAIYAVILRKETSE